MAYSVKWNNIFKGYDKNATLEFVLPDVAPSPQTRKPGIENAVYNDSSTESDQIWLQINFISQKKRKKLTSTFFLQISTLTLLFQKNLYSIYPLFDMTFRQKKTISFNLNLFIFL